MSNTPAEKPTNGTKTPTFPRVEMESDFDDILACAATLSGKTISEVKQLAVAKCKIPAHGPYWFTEQMINRLFGAIGLVSTPYHQVTGPLADIPPDTALLLIDYDPETEIGRHVIMHRVRTGAGAMAATIYVIDPASWTDTSRQIQADPKTLAPAYWIGIHDPTQSTTKAKK